MVTGTAAALLACAAVVVALTRDPGGEPPLSRVVAAGERAGDAVTTSSSVPAPVETTTTSTSAVPATVRPVATTVARTTTVAPPTSTSTTAPTTTTTVAAGQPCTAAQIEVVATTDKPTYAPGQPVKVTSSIRNRSSTTCSYASYSFGSSFKDPDGKVLLGSGLVADNFADTPFGPGQTFRHSAAWDQRTCPEPTCGRAAPGTYSVVVTWGFPGGPYVVTLSFTLT